ncbi:MAG TPA: AbrB family transcriptional regulator [Solirubrobacter sp.]|nr:AbrB family transcriptional regulator [Solirubrobacter sp.]
MRTVAPWIVLGAATAAASLALAAVGLPSPTLFAALLVGLAAALLVPGSSHQLPNSAFIAAQAVCGVTLGAYLQSDALETTAGSWLPVALVSAGTLALSVGAGWGLARMTELDRPTATLGMIAGGASGIVGMARELGGDDRLVAFMQYLRVLIVVLATPLLVTIFAGGGDGIAMPDEAPLATVGDWLITAAVAPAGAVLARRVRMPAGTLLGPMLLAGALTLAGVGFVVPPVVRELSFALIGLQVGLRFTLDTVRQLGRLLIPVLAALVGIMAGCFVLALGLAATTPLSVRDSYLATTPGGIYAVLAVAFGAGANTTFILAVQGLRLLVVVLLAPVAVRRVARPGRDVSMRETPITPDDPDIPDDPPPAEDGSPETDDQPLGVPADLDEDDAPLPGLPENEPPQAD